MPTWRSGGAEPGKRYLTQRLALDREDPDLRRDVVEVLDEELPARQREILHHIRPGGNNLLPFVARRIVEVHRHDSIAGSIPVRLHDEAVTGEIAVEVGVEVVDDGSDRTLGGD